MSTKEEFREALKTLEGFADNAFLVTTKQKAREALGTICIHLAEKDAEIAELRDALIQVSRTLAERFDKYLAVKAELSALKAKVEGSPKVWLVKAKGVYQTGGCSPFHGEAIEAWKDLCEHTNGERPVEGEEVPVYAVPVIPR